MNMLLPHHTWKLLILAAVLAGWAGLPARDHSQEVRRELLSLMAARRTLLERNAETMRHQFTPGFKAQHPLVAEAPALFTQGEIFKTGCSTNLAVNGEGWFGLQKGNERAYTRDGRFTFQDGHLRNGEGWELLGYPAGSLKLEAVELNLDPNTKLYGGRYTGFRLDQAGQLMGESTLMDPVTGQMTVQFSEPLFQVALFRLDGQAQPLTDTLWACDRATGGKAGAETLGCICPGSLELSSVNFSRLSASFASIRNSLSPFSCGLEPCQVHDVRLELKDRIRRDPDFRRDCLDQARYALTPGARQVAIAGLGPPPSPRFESTGSATDLAVRGEGYLLLDDGRLARGASFRVDERGCWLDCQSGAVLMGGAPERPQPLAMGSRARLYEVSSDGELRWQDRGTQRALVLLVECDQVVPDGAYVRPAPGASLRRAGPGVRLHQGELRLPGQDPYTSRLAGWALMDFAGLPLVPNEAPLQISNFNKAPVISNFANESMLNPVNKKFKF